MKTLKINVPVLLLITLLTGFFSVQAQTFQWKRTLLPQGTSGWHNFTIPPGMAGKTNAGYSDMRILAISKEGDTAEAPYIITNSVLRKMNTANNLKILNKSTLGGRFYYTLQQPQKIETLNEITLHFSEKNFDLKVVLEGSMDQQQWFTILKDYRITGIKNSKADFQFTTLNFNFSNYRFYRLIIPAEQDPNLLDAQSGITMDLNEGVWWEFKGSHQKTEWQKNSRQTICTVDLEEPLPVSMVKLNIKESVDYFRPISIEAIPWPDNNAMQRENPYVNIGSGTLNSFDGQNIAVSEVLTKQVKIIIRDNDNIPLQIDSVTLKTGKKLVITRLPEAENYLLVYGNKNLGAPSYDLEEVLDKMAMPDLLNITTGPELRNLPEKPKSRWENKSWLYVLMGIIIIMLGGFTLTMMKKKA